MAIHGVDFVVHYVPNLEEAVSFYQDTLGLKLELHNPDWNWAEFSLSPITLVLFGTYPGAPLENGRGGAGLALAVDDFDGTVKELGKNGVESSGGRMNSLPVT